MIFSKTLLFLGTFLATTSFALVTAEINTCVKLINGHIFNLCSFKEPFSVPSVHGEEGPYNVTFSVNQPNTPSCQNSTLNSWITAVALQNQTCASTTVEPSFYNITDLFGNPGIQFHYSWQDHEFVDVYVTLVCNKTAPHNAHVDFPYSGFYEGDFIATGHSYYGCPLKAGDSNFLQLDH